MAILTVISFKGGVGKSMISQNIAVHFSLLKKDVCIIDADPTAKGSQHWHDKRSDEAPPVDVYHLPKNANLIKLCNQLESKYEIIIIDCPPASEKITTIALSKADFSVVPVSTKGGSDLQVFEEFLEHLELIRGKLAAPLPSYLVLNFFKPKMVLHKSFKTAIENLTEEYQMPIIATIGDRVSFGEASAIGMGIMEWKDDKAKNEINVLCEFINQKITENGEK